MPATTTSQAKIRDDFLQTPTVQVTTHRREGIRTASTGSSGQRALLHRLRDRVRAEQLDMGEYDNYYTSLSLDGQIVNATRSSRRDCKFS